MNECKSSFRVEFEFCVADNLFKDRARLIPNSTSFEVSVKSLSDRYYFMFKNSG